MALPRRNHRIALSDAARLTRRFRESGAGTEKGGAFHADPVRRLLAQPGCTDLRYYHGLDESGAPTLILVGVDADNADLTRGPVLDLHIPCPPFCGPTTVLNSAANLVAERLGRALRVTAVTLPERDHRVDLETAAELTRRFRASGAGEEKGGAFHADQVWELLEQPGCVALRYYHGRDDADRPAVVLVGMNAEGADMTWGPVMDLHIPCPPFCGTTSPLNAPWGAALVRDAWHEEPALAGIA